MANLPTTTSGPTTRNQPVHEVRLGSIKAAIWQNETDVGVRFNVTFERLYNQDGEWRSTGSFGRDDLLLLRKVADLAHSWIAEPDVAGSGAATRADRKGMVDLTDNSLPKRSSGPQPAE